MDTANPADSMRDDVPYTQCRFHGRPSYFSALNFALQGVPSLALQDAYTMEWWGDLRDEFDDFLAETPMFRPAAWNWAGSTHNNQADGRPLWYHQAQVFRTELRVWRPGTPPTPPVYQTVPTYGWVAEPVDYPVVFVTLATSGNVVVSCTPNARQQARGVTARQVIVANNVNPSGATPVTMTLQIVDFQVTVTVTRSDSSTFTAIGGFDLTVPGASAACLSMSGRPT